ncbi:MAG: hypothetical protein EBS36_06940 [Actinobacteria bacterium]|jgi:hypothetical protein|nr:hypothetical protein [Actinomycetota bacterium]
MALRKIFTIEGEGFVQTSGGQINIGNQKAVFTAYCKITKIISDKLTGYVTLECVGETYRIINNYSVEFSVADGAENFIRQAYLHLKTLPEFAGAEDC